jgi:uncharacterized protein YkwD
VALLALPASAGTASAHQRRTAPHVRAPHVRHHPAHKLAKQSCPRHKNKSHKAGEHAKRGHKAYKHAKRSHNAGGRAKRAGSCRQHTKSVGHAHKRVVHAHKRAVHHSHKRIARPNHSRPAIASRECRDANLTPKQGNIETVVAATLCLINNERARIGEPALLEDARLASAAAGHSRDMDTRGYFEHVSPSGQTVLMRIQASGFIPNGGRVGYAIGENIAWGTLWLGTPRAIVHAWMASPGHRANILDGAYRYTGIGIDPNLPHSMSDGQAGGMYTQDFGSITG